MLHRVLQEEEEEASRLFILHSLCTDVNTYIARGSRVGNANMVLSLKRRQGDSGGGGGGGNSWQSSYISKLLHLSN